MHDGQNMGSKKGELSKKTLIERK